MNTIYKDLKRIPSENIFSIYKYVNSHIFARK